MRFQGRWSVTPQQRLLLERTGRRLKKQIERVIDGTELKGRVGFVLLTFTWQAGFASHVTNARRDDMIKLLREYADALEAHRVEDPLRGGESDG